MDLSVFQATGVDDPDAQISVDEWNALLAAIEAGAVSGVEAADSRSAIEALSPVSGETRILRESGREGLFVFDDSDLSTQVAADALQGVYVAPASDPTGASGAWVRSFSGSIDVRWFGYVADDDGVTGTDNLAAIEAALAVASSYVGLSYFELRPSLSVYLPAGQAYVSGPINIRVTTRLHGEATSQTAGPATRLRFLSGSAGIIVNRHTSDGYDEAAVTSTFGDGSIIENIGLLGGTRNVVGGGAAYDANAEADGILLRGRAVIRDVWVNSFARNGIAILAGSDGNPMLGNANNFVLERVTSKYNGQHGLHVAGTDANAGLVTMLDASFNRMFGILDESFLGNTYIAPHADSNGFSPAAPFALVHRGGHRYYVKAGQAVGAATNAPSGTTADNTWWGYLNDFGVVAGVPEWTSGVAVAEGGSYKTSNANAQNVFINPYAEGGQAPFRTVSPTIIHGGLLYNGIIGTGAWLRNSDGALRVNKIKVDELLTVPANSTFGPSSGAAADNNLYFDNTNFSSILWFRSWSAGVPQTDGYIFASRSGGMFFNGKLGISFRFDGNTVASVDSNSFNLASGKVLKVNGTQVVGAQGAAVADATDAASAITQLNALLARCRAHGLIAT